MNRRLISSLAMTLMLAVGSSLPPAAQDEAPQTEQPPATSAAADPAARDAQRPIRATDAALARWLIDDHRAEIAISQWAEQALENPQLVEYAKKMIEDHQQMVAELEPLSRGGRERVRQRGEGTQEVEVDVPGVELDIEVDRDNVRDAARRAAEAARRAAARAEDRREDRLERRGDRAQDRRTRREGADADDPTETRVEQRVQRRGEMRGNRGPTDWLRIKAELSDQSVQSSRETLERYEGDEQIAAFLGMQLVQHQRMLDTLTVFRNHASPELTRILEQSAEKVQGHLQMAGRLMGEVSRK